MAMQPLHHGESSPERRVSDDEKHGSHHMHADHVDSAAHGSPEEDESLGPQTMSIKSWLALLSLLLAFNGYLFTQIMPAAVLSYINAELGPDTNYVWISVAWNLVAAVVVTVSGRFADIFGRRWFLIAGGAISTVGGVVGATSHSINQSIASGVLFGLGGGMQEMVFSCMQEMVPFNRRILIMGIFEFGNLPSMFSSIISYAFIAYVGSGWRACYYLIIAVEGLATVTMVLWYHPPSFATKHLLDQSSRLQLIMETDFVGLVLFSAGCTLILLAINWGGVLNPWGSAAVIAPLIVGVVLLVALGFWEAYANLKHPLLPLRLFRRFRDFTAIIMVGFVAGMLYYSNLIIWPRLTSLLWVGPTEIIKRGIYANIPNWCTPLAALYIMLIAPRVHHERWQLTFLATMQTVFSGALASIGTNTQAQAIAFLVIAGTSATSANLLIFGMVGLHLQDQADIGVALGLVSTARLIGGAAAGAIYTSIYTNRYAQEIPDVLNSFAASAGFQGSFAALLKASATNTAAAYNAVAGMTPQVLAAAQSAVQEAYIRSFRLVFLVALAFGVVAVCAAVSTRSVPMEKKTGKRAVTMENEKGQRGTAEHGA